MCGTWQLRGGTPDESKTSDKLALGILKNCGRKGVECWNCGKEGHKRSGCKTEKETRAIKVAEIKVVAIRVVKTRRTVIYAAVISIPRLSVSESLETLDTRILRSPEALIKLVQSRSILLTLNIFSLGQRNW